MVILEISLKEEVAFFKIKARIWSEVLETVDLKDDDLKTILMCKH